MDDVDGLDEFEDQIAALERSLGGARGMASLFDAELSRVQGTFAETERQVASMSRGFSRGLRNAFEGVIFDGDKLGDALRGLADSFSQTAYNAAVRPVFNHFGGLLATGAESLVGGLLPFEKGASFAQGRVMPFAKGGVISGATYFPLRGATGLMGEAGPEAIMPLTRGSDGSLGVRAEAQRPVTVVMNISTPDVQGFERSKSQIAAQMGRVLGRGQRNR